MKKNTLTQAQENALDIMRESAYYADGTKISDLTGYALKRRGLATWSDGQQAWIITKKGYEISDQI